MSFRLLLALIFGASFALSFGFIIVSIAFLRGQLAALFPPDLAVETDHALHMLLLGQAVGLLVFALITAVVIFFVIVNLFERPLRALSAAMDAYALDGRRDIVADIDQAPLEIRSLATSFTALMDKIEQGHSRDTEISRIKSDFIATAAHQFRTPLTGIRWALEALLKEPVSDTQKALLQSAMDKSQDLVGIVGTLLDISSIESGKHKYQFAPTDLVALAAEVAGGFNELATRAQVSLYVVPTESALPNVRADAERIKWILTNLIENAIRYTPAQGSVRVSCDAGADRVYLRVRDTGIGIQPQDRANIFERFYRGKNAIEKETQGNGLGLYIARTIATDHGGDLRFQANEDGPGTTFVLSLPFAA